MKTFRQKVVAYSQFIFRIIAFILSAVLLYLVLPSEPHFKYEYQRGIPWKHRNLVAPFDFAVMKSSPEIEAERKELTKDFAPYFSVDTFMVRLKTEELRKDIQEVLPEDYSRKEEVINIAVKHLSMIYTAGVLTSSPQYTEILAEKKEISLVTGNNVEKIAVSNLLSEKSAYNVFSDLMDEVKNKYPGIALHLNTLDLGKYIRSNLRYDDTHSNSELTRLEKSVPTASGMMQEGERIIFEGEIVDDAKFQILESLKENYQQRKGEGINSQMVSVGKLLLILIFLTLLFAFLYTYKRFILDDAGKLSFLLLFIITIVFLALTINTYKDLHIYMFPFAILPVVIRTFYDSRTAIFTLIVTSLLIGFYAPNNYQFVLLEVTAGMMAVFSLNKNHRRVHVVIASSLVALTYGIVYLAITLIEEGALAFNFHILKWFAWSSLLVLVVYPLIYIFEKAFGFVSDVTMIELSNTNQPLLRKLAEEAPGTLQHSLQIANLAEEVILKIGGNPFLARAGALYHDIGKVAQPSYFIENQEIGMNPHDQISYIKSAEIIIDHVKNGIKTAKKYKLPASIMEFIATHHGTSKAKYFYLKQQQDNPDEVINESDFAYPGPLPRSREAAVVMLIDSIEAASRSMKEKTFSNFKTLIDNMTEQKIRERQLDNSDLTFADIDKIKEILLHKLVNIYHVRIEYPAEKK